MSKNRSPQQEAWNSLCHAPGDQSVVIRRGARVGSTLPTILPRRPKNHRRKPADDRVILSAAKNLIDALRAIERQLTRHPVSSASLTNNRRPGVRQILRGVELGNFFQKDQSAKDEISVKFVRIRGGDLGKSITFAMTNNGKKDIDAIKGGNLVQVSRDEAYIRCAASRKESTQAMRYRAYLLAALVVSATSLADSPKPAGPVSPAAKSALAKLETAKSKAAQDYQIAVNAATRQAVQELEVAKQAAMKAGNLTEANAIQSAIDDMKPKNAQPQDLREWIIRTQTLQYQFANGDARTLTFLPDGTIDGAGGPWEKKWKVNGDVLIISGSNGEESFYRCSDGAFRGIWNSGRGAVFFAKKP